MTLGDRKSKSSPEKFLPALLIVLMLLAALPPGCMEKSNQMQGIPEINGTVIIDAPFFVELDESESPKGDKFHSHFGLGGFPSVKVEDAEELKCWWVRFPIDIPVEDEEMIEGVYECLVKGGFEIYGIVNLLQKMAFDEFEERVKELARNYKDIKVWEIFNEVATTAPLVGISKEDYYQYAKIARRVIEEEIGNCTIVSGTIVDDLDEYVKYVLERNSSIFDAISFHSYHPFLNADIISKKLAEMGINKPIYLTESQFGGMHFRVDIDNYTLARVMVESYVFAFANGFEKVFPSELREMENFPEGLKHSCFISIDGEKKPAFYAYKTLVEKIDYFDKVEEINGNYKFSIGNKTVFVILNSNLPEEIKGKDVIVTLINGTSFKINSDNIEVNELVLSEDFLKKWEQPIPAGEFGEVESAVSVYVSTSDDGIHFSDSQKLFPGSVT